MTKVETEVVWRKNELLALCSTTDIALNEIILKHFDSLISVAHASGVAEGVLEENAKWEQWAGCSRHPQINCKCSTVPVLAPTKEVAG